MRIAIDLMGSDSSPSDLFKGVLQSLESLDKKDRLVILATPSIIKKISSSQISKQIKFHPVSEYIKMSDDPKQSVRRKKASSMIVGLDLLHAKKVDALISAGNTGALVLSARMRLNLLPHIQVPALLTLLPTEKEMMAVLDVGGVVLTQPESFVQYALTGSSFMKTFFKRKTPRIGLLNIGTESGKGTSIHQQAFQLLEQKLGTSFKGNIEGKEAFEGIVDVLVTDGFTGNVFLKTAEGVSAFLMKTFQKEYKSIPSAIQRRFDYEEYPGAILCGVEGLVIKCHGSSTAKSMCHSILAVKRLIKSNGPKWTKMDQNGPKYLQT